MIWNPSLYCHMQIIWTFYANSKSFRLRGYRKCSQKLSWKVISNGQIKNALKYAECTFNCQQTGIRYSMAANTQLGETKVDTVEIYLNNLVYISLITSEGQINNNIGSTMLFCLKELHAFHISQQKIHSISSLTCHEQNTLKIILFKLWFLSQTTLLPSRFPAQHFRFN